MKYLSLKEKINKKILSSLIIVIIFLGSLGLFLYQLYNFLSPDCSLPLYTNEDFTLGVEPEKETGSLSFALFRDKRNNLCLYSSKEVHFLGKWERLWSKAIKIKPELVKHAWYNPDKNELFLGIIANNNLEIKIVSAEKLWVFTKKVINVNYPEKLSSIFFIDYNPKLGKFIIMANSLSNTPKSCQNIREIFTLDLNANKKIIEHVGDKCNTLPGYAGYNGKQLFFIKRGEEIEDPYYRLKLKIKELQIIEIYSINPLTLKKEIILSIPDIPKNVHEMHIFRDEANRIGLLFPFGMYRYDIEKKGFLCIKEGSLYSQEIGIQTTNGCN